MKILGIDDNEDLLNLCELALSSEGHEYTGINNGREGLQAIKDKKFDAVLLDLAMPASHYYDVLKRVKIQPTLLLHLRLPRIISSSQTDHILVLHPTTHIPQKLLQMQYG